VDGLRRGGSEGGWIGGGEGKERRVVVHDGDGCGFERMGVVCRHQQKRRAEYSFFLILRHTG